MIEWHEMSPTKLFKDTLESAGEMTLYGVEKLSGYADVETFVFRLDSTEYRISEDSLEEKIRCSEPILVPNPESFFRVLATISFPEGIIYLRDTTTKAVIVEVGFDKSGEMVAKYVPGAGKELYPELITLDGEEDEAFDTTGPTWIEIIPESREDMLEDYGDDWGAFG